MANVEIAVELKPFPAVVPPSSVKDPLENYPGQNTLHRPYYGAANQQKQPVSPKLYKKYGIEYCPQPIRRTEGQRHKTGIHKSSLLHCIYNNTGTPAQKRIKNKDPAQLIQ